MEPILFAAIIMVWVVAMVILLMTSLGYDVRSRGFETGGPVAATLPKLGITVGAYFKKKAEHPVTNPVYAKKAKFYLIMTFVSVVILIVLIVTLSFL